MDTDADLLRSYAQAHIQTAFSEFVRRRLDLVYSSALRRTGGNRALAAEVAQNVFLAAAQNALKLSRHPATVAWLYTATRNAALNLMRDELRRSRLAEEMRHEPTTFSPASETSWEAMRPHLEGALDRLSERDRHAILLRFFEGYSFAVIGTQLRLSENAARMRVDRALARLRSHFGAHGVTSSGAAIVTALVQNSVSAAPTGLSAGISSAVFTGAAASIPITFGFSTLTLMSLNKVLLGSLALVAVLGVGGAFYEYRSAAQANSDQARLQATTQSAVALERSTEEKLLTAQHALTASEERNRQLLAELDAAKAARTKPADIARPDPFANPDYARATMDKFRAGLGLKYLSLYRKLGLTPEQVAKFESVMVEAQQGIVDIWTESALRGLSSGNGSPGATTVARLTSEPLKARDDELKSLLGEASFGEFQNLEKNRTANDVVGTLAATLYSSETPLSGEQGAALTSLIASNTQKIKIPMASDGKTPLFRIYEKTDWSAVVAQAQAMLSTVQVSALRALGEQQEAELELRRSSQ